MKIAFVNIITEHVYTQFRLVNKISDYLEKELSTKEYGKGVSTAIFGIGCGGPLSDDWKDTSTGDVSQLKYTKSKKTLELTVNLSYSEVKDANEELLISIVKNGIMNSCSEVNSLRIDEFNVIAFYADLEKLLNNRDWLNHPEKYKKEPFKFKLEDSSQEILSEERMNTDDFWSLIHNSIEKSKGNIVNQIDYIINYLALQREESIISFEYTFREYIKRAYDYNVLGLLKVLDDNITDDSFLYFRCRLILYGREIFYSVLRNPNLLDKELSNDYQAEFLLNAADNAYQIKFGNMNNKELPSEIASKYIDYNIDSYPMMGIPWSEKNFTKRYALLIKLYNK